MVRTFSLLEVGCQEVLLFLARISQITRFFIFVVTVGI